MYQYQMERLRLTKLVGLDLTTVHLALHAVDSRRTGEGRMNVLLNASEVTTDTQLSADEGHKKLAHSQLTEVCCISVFAQAAVSSQQVQQVTDWALGT